MLEKIPSAVGRALRKARAGFEKVAAEDPFGSAPDTIEVSSPAFADGDRLPARFTADGEGASPPLSWSPVSGAVAYVLLVEDPDAPAPEPLVHLLAWNLPGETLQVDEGRFSGEAREDELGRNAYLQARYLPPDPPSGHGVHRYAFQVFALDGSLDLDGAPGRGAVLDQMKGHVLAKGLLVGSYERS